MPNADKSPFITSGERVRNYFLLAFVASLVLHVLVAPFMKNITQHTEEQQVEKVSVTKRIIVKPPTPPPPTPTPPPPKVTPPPKQVKQVTVPQPKLKVEPPKVSSNTGSGPSQAKYVPPKTGSENGVPSGEGTAKPGPVTATAGPPASTPTPKPACANPMQEATATQSVTPDYPENAREQGLGRVEVNVVVSLSASGAPTSATVQNTSGNMEMDRAARQAAMQSTYSPKVVNCQPVPSQYIYHITFDPNG